eukprot:GHVU01070066.1.p1 GENE.GHVU01070066.1~~GHVU01070066.1.p1  ORF type:complete len:235 (+),score=10.54 GHVU01070066.1:268-972(+)
MISEQEELEERRRRRRRLVVTWLHQQPPRNPVLVRHRIPASIRIEQQLQLGLFERYNRMDVSAFETLLAKIAGSLVVDEAHSISRTGIPPLEPATKLQLTIAWLAGGWYMDLIWHAGITHPHFYDTVYSTMDAIIACSDLDYVFPQSQEDIQAAAADFRSVSIKGVIRSCPVVFDGWCCETEAQPSSRVANPAAYYSGRYRCHGINVQVSTYILSYIPSHVHLHTPRGTSPEGR